jgi:hypothetical protein
VFQGGRTVKSVEPLSGKAFGLGDEHWLERMPCVGYALLTKFTSPKHRLSQNKYLSVINHLLRSLALLRLI